MATFMDMIQPHRADKANSLRAKELEIKNDNP